MLRKIIIMAAMIGSLTNPVWAEENSVQVKGSDTMVHLSSAWAEKFMQKNPGIEVAVTGGGSGTGISALLNKTTDLANSSRPMSASEKNAIKGQGDEVVETIVGMDGIAVIVNPSNSIKVLSMNQIKQIYTGQVDNWKQLGGQDAKIMVYTRDSSSGTYAFFQEHVLLKKDYSVRARRLASNSALVQSVSEDLNAIGYVGLGYVTEAGKKIKALKVKKNETDADGIVPSVESVKSRAYPISRPLYIYSRGKLTGSTKTFVEYMLGDEGQTIVEEMGFVRLK